MILRQVYPDVFEVIGECLPHPWKMRHKRGKSFYEPGFIYSITEEVSQEDPRLGPLPKKWERVELERTPDDPLLFAPHRNTVTGEIINSDPRMFPEALKARGIKFQQLRLV